MIPDKSYEVGIFLLPAGYSLLPSVRTRRKEGLPRERKSMPDLNVLRMAIRDTVLVPISQEFECLPTQEDADES